MDAARVSIRKRVLLPAISFLLASTASAVAPSFVFPGGTTINLPSNQGLPITANSSGAAITFSTTTVYSGSDLPWLTVNGAATTTGTTPATIIFQVGLQAGLLSLGTHTATVTLTPTAGDTTGASPAPLTITYTTGSGGPGGGGGALVSASPTPLTLPAAAIGGFAAGSITLTSTSNTPIAFSIPAQPAAWVTVSPTSGTVSSASPVTLSVSANAAGLSNFNYTATLTVNYGAASPLTDTIQWAVGTGVGGGGSGTLSAVPSSVSWTFTTSGALPSPATIQLQSTSNAPTFNATVTSSNNWLVIANGGSGGNLSIVSGALNQGITLLPSANLFSLTTGTYTGTVTATASDGSTAAIAVTLTVNGGGSTGGLTLTPNPVTLSAASGTSAISQQPVSVNSTISGTLTTAVSGSGLTVSQASSTVTAGTNASITVSANPSGLPAGTYNGSLTATVTPASGTAVTQTISVVFTVGSGSGGANTGIVAPTALNFAFQSGTAAPLGQFITISGVGAYTTTISVGTTPQQWLSITPATGTGPTLATVAVSTAGLAVGSYTGTITVNSASGSQTVSVTLLVTASPVLIANPPTLNVDYSAGSPSPAINLYVNASDNSAAPLSVSATATWVTIVSTGSVATPATYGVQLNLAGLANGVYTANIVFTATGVANATMNVPVTVTVTGSTVSGSLTLSASSLTFAAQVNGAAPAPQTVKVTAPTATVFSVTTTGAWLSVSPSGTLSTDTSLTISVNQTGLAIQTYSGSINLTAGGVLQEIPVTLVVSATGGSAGNISVSANGQGGAPALAFTYVSGAAAPPAETLNVTNAVAGSASIPLTIAVTTQNGSGWLSTNPAPGTNAATPLTISVAVNATGLATGTYTGTVTITPNGGTAVAVPVTLTVQAPPSVSLSTTTLSFAFQAGGSLPVPGSVQVTGGGAALGFSATASSSGWLSVTPTAGTTPTSLNVTANPAGLGAGSYSGTITVSGTGGALGSSTVNVTLTVTAPLPTITAVVSAASYIGGPVSPGEIVTIGGTNIGPATPVNLALDQSGNVSTSIGGVQVLLNGVAAPLTYVSSTQINAVVPYEIAGVVSPFVQVKFLGQTSNAFNLTATTAAPGIFTLNSAGTGPGAILNSNLSTNSPGNPAPKGGIVAVYMTGEGQTSPAGVTGKVTNGTTIAQLPVPLLPVSVLVDGQPANFTFAGEAPGFVSGVMQVNVVIPPNAATGGLSLVISVGGKSSQTGVTVSVQ